MIGTTSSGISDNLGDIYSKFVNFQYFGPSLRFWNINASKRLSETPMPSLPYLYSQFRHSLK